MCTCSTLTEEMIKFCEALKQSFVNINLAQLNSELQKISKNLFKDTEEANSLEKPFCVI